MESLPFFNSSIRWDKSKPKVALENLEKKENLKEKKRHFVHHTYWKPKKTWHCISCLVSLCAARKYIQISFNECFNLSTFSIGSSICYQICFSHVTIRAHFLVCCL